VADPLTTEELYGRLRRHVLGKDDEQGGPAFLFREVTVGDRRADAMSFGLWRSRGYAIQGYELKTNRGDWLREFEDHGKAEPVMEIADRFWLVTNPDVLVAGELPDSWGLLVAQGRNRKLKIVKPAPLLREGEPPLSREMMVKVLRGIHGLNFEKIEAIRAQERERFEKKGPEDIARAEQRMREAEQRAEELSRAYQAFKQESGVDFLSWRPDHEELEVLGKLVKALKGGPYSDEFDALRKMLKRDEDRVVAARGLLKQARQTMDEMEEREWRRAGKQPPEKDEVF
jgi:hypothetical protein